jgi:hypothetical protein
MKNLNKISRQRFGAHTPRVSPDYSIAAQHHSRSNAKQWWN